MKLKKKFGLQSQGYEAPRAESVAVAQESILCASSLNLKGANEGFSTGDGFWDSSEGM